jgi:hypothetical protein
MIFALYPISAFAHLRPSGPGAATTLWGRSNHRASRLTLARPHREAMGRGDRHQIFNEFSMHVTTCTPSQILSPSNSISTRPSRPTQRP